VAAAQGRFADAPRSLEFDRHRRGAYNHPKVLARLEAAAAAPKVEAE